MTQKRKDRRRVWARLRGYAQRRVAVLICRVDCRKTVGVPQNPRDNLNIRRFARIVQGSAAALAALLHQTGAVCHQGTHMRECTVSTGIVEKGQACTAYALRRLKSWVDYLQKRDIGEQQQQHIEKGLVEVIHISRTFVLSLSLSLSLSRVQNGSDIV